MGKRKQEGQRRRISSARMGLQESFDLKLVSIPSAQPTANAAIETASGWSGASVWQQQKLLTTMWGDSAQH